MNDMTHKPKDVLEAITAEQCENLKNNLGIDGDKNGNCEDISGQLIDDIAQELANVLSAGNVTIFANEDSKCSPDDENTTLASMWSRIYRFSQAVSCILCAYDPFIATLIKSGRYPQILMGAVQAGGYPQWMNPDETPTENSKLPVTSDGVYKAIQSAIMSVWHLWEEYPAFDYYAEDKDALESQSGAENNNTAMVKDGEDGKNQIYTYDGQNWTGGTVLGVDGVENFAVTHIANGDYEDKAIYYFKEETDNLPTWNLLNAQLGDIESRLSSLEEQQEKAVHSQDGETGYLLTTRPTLADAMDVPATEGKTTITLITG